jgi:hypothetical protein
MVDVARRSLTDGLGSAAVRAYKPSFSGVVPAVGVRVAVQAAYARRCKAAIDVLEFAEVATKAARLLLELNAFRYNRVSET